VSADPRVVVAAPDKFRSTATARQVVDAVAAAVEIGGGVVRRCPLADGGEGTLDAFGGANRWSEVTGPLGNPVRAGWRLDGTTAVLEMAEASGLLVAGGVDGNAPELATTRGTGELLAAAMAAGATEILVGAGGSATTDGGLGAVQALLLTSHRPFRDVSVRVCADVTTGFADAAAVFGPQKGADAAAIARLTARLIRTAHYYLDRFGVDVTTLPRSGAAGGLAGGLAALGAELVDGFAAIADLVGLDVALRGADLVVTGEGRLDGASLQGKVVGGVIDRAARSGVPVLVIAGHIDPAVVLPAAVTAVSLTDRFGRERAFGETAELIAAVVTEHLMAAS
jgi:glycerate kinase